MHRFAIEFTASPYFMEKLPENFKLIRYVVDTDNFDQAVILAKAFMRGIKTNPSVWMVQITKIEKI